MWRKWPSRLKWYTEINAWAHSASNLTNTSRANQHCRRVVCRILIVFMTLLKRASQYFCFPEIPHPFPLHVSTYFTLLHIWFCLFVFLPEPHEVWLNQSARLIRLVALSLSRFCIWKTLGIYNSVPLSFRINGLISWAMELFHPHYSH